jgi:acyl carrier protein
MGLFSKLRGKTPEVVRQHTGPVTESDIQQWLVARIAAIAEMKPEEVDVDRPFAEFGMDSVQLFELSGDLEDFLGRKVSEIVAWDFPTIAKMSQHLSTPGAEARVTANMAAGEGSW